MTLSVSPFKCPGLLHGGEDTSRVHKLLHTSITSCNAGGIALMEDSDRLSIDDKLPILSLYCAVERAMDRVLLKHTDHIVEVNDSSLMAMISTLPDMTAAMGIRHPMQSNAFTATFTIVSHG